MQMIVTASGTNPQGQRVEYRREYSWKSTADRRAAVYVSGERVALGWNMDGITYAAYQAALRGE